MPAKTKKPLPGVMTVEEAATRLGVSVRRVRQLCQSGRLGARLHGRDWAIPAQSVAEYQPRPVGRPANPDAK